MKGVKMTNKFIPMVEMFYSLQGEVSGAPSIFVRSALCCFQCRGFGCKVIAPDGAEVIGCDTVKSTSTKFKSLWTYYEDYMSLVKDIQKLRNPNMIKHNRFEEIVWTGGEPLLWWNTEIMQNTLAYFVSRGHKITIETNASLDIEFFREYQKQFQFSMSVKLEHSGEPKEKRINIETITKIIENCPSSYLKFVINPETWDSDVLEIREILDAVPYYITVYLMPLGGNRKQLEENTRFVFEKAAQCGFNYCDRYHIRSYDTKEAV